MLPPVRWLLHAEFVAVVALDRDQVDAIIGGLVLQIRAPLGGLVVQVRARQDVARVAVIFAHARLRDVLRHVRHAFIGPLSRGAAAVVAV